MYDGVIIGGKITTAREYTSEKGLMIGDYCRKAKLLPSICSGALVAEGSILHSTGRLVSSMGVCTLSCNMMLVTSTTRCDIFVIAD